MQHPSIDDKARAIIEATISQQFSGASAPVALDVQIECGQWLAWKRRQLSLTQEALAEQVGMPLRTLVLIEQGLATPSLLNDQPFWRIGRVLADSNTPADMITEIVRCCAGTHRPLATLLKRVSSELAAFRPDVSEQAVGEVADSIAQDAIEAFVSATSPIGSSNVLEAEGVYPANIAPRLRPEVEHMLMELAKDDLSIFDMGRILRERHPSMTLARLGGLMDLMEEGKLVEIQADVETYVITPNGRDVLSMIRKHKHQSQDTGSGIQRWREFVATLPKGLLLASG